VLTLLASAARTTSDNSGSLSSVFKHPELVERLSLFLDVTAAATDVGDTLDVYLQTTHDGTVWDDVAHFTQVLGNGGAKQFIAEWFRNMAPESEMHAPQDAAVSAGVVQGGKLGVDTRIKWVIVDGDADGSFTFSVKADPIYNRR